ALSICAGAVVSLEVPLLTVALVVVALGAIAAVSAFADSPRNRRAVAATVGAPSSAVRPRADVITDDPMRRALPFTTLLTMFVLAIDTQRFLVTSSMRYALLVIPLFALSGAAAACGRSRLAPTTLPDKFLLVLTGCGLIGAVVGKVFLGTPNPGLVIF